MDVPLPPYPYGKSLYKPYIVGIYGLQSRRIPREHNKYHGYTVRGTSNRPLKNSPVSGSFWRISLPVGSVVGPLCPAHCQDSETTSSRRSQAVDEFIPDLLHPGKLTWNPKPWRFGSDDFPFNWVIVGFHVNFQGCTLSPIIVPMESYPNKGTETHIKGTHFTLNHDFLEKEYQRKHAIRAVLRGRNAGFPENPPFFPKTTLGTFSRGMLKKAAKNRGSVGLSAHQGLCPVLRLFLFLGFAD